MPSRKCERLGLGDGAPGHFGFHQCVSRRSCFQDLTNGFSKKIQNHDAAIALHYMWYNFVRIHQTLRVTPAMAAGVSDHVWPFQEVVRLTEGKRVAVAA